MPQRDTRRWRRTNTPDARDHGRYDDIWFVSEHIGWGVNGAGQIVKTIDGAHGLHVFGQMPADRIETPFRIDARATASIRRPRLAAGHTHGDQRVLGRRLIDDLLDPDFNLPAVGEVVLIKEALCRTEPKPR